MQDKKLDKKIEEIVVTLMEDLNDRSGYDLPVDDKETMREWKETWIRLAKKVLEEE